MYKQERKKKSTTGEIKGKKSFNLATEAHQRYILRTNIEDLNEAVNQYIETIKTNPEIPETYYRLATLMYENRQITLEGAIEQCTRAVGLAPNNADAHVYLGYFLALNGELEKADEHFKKAIKLNPISSARVRLIMGMTDFKEKKGAKNFIKACYMTLSGLLLFLVNKNSMRMFAKNFKDNVNFAKYQALGNIYEKMHKVEDAYKLYYKALDEGKNQPVLYEKMARLATIKEKYDIALHCYQNAVKLSGNSPDAVVNMIEFLEEKYPERTDDLIDSYNLLANKKPTFSRCYYELGHLYLRKNELLNALNAFKYALDFEPENPFYINSLAFTFVQLEQYDDAIKLYKKAISLNPDNEWTAIVIQALATLYHQIKGESRIAISLLGDSLLLTEKKAQIYQTIADIYYDLDDLDNALTYYKRALNYDTEDSRAYSRLAMVYWEKDLIEEAITNYVKAIELDPDYEIGYNNLGVIFLDGLGDINRAKTYFETAIDIKDDYVLAHFNLGRTYEALDKKVQAAGEYQKALDKNALNFEIDENIITERLYKLFEA